MIFKEIDFILFWFDFLSHLPCTIGKYLFFLLKFTYFFLEASKFFFSWFKILLFILQLLLFFIHCLVYWIQFIFEIFCNTTNLLIFRHKLNDFIIHHSAISLKWFDSIRILCWFYSFLVLDFSYFLADFIQFCLMLLFDLVDFFRERLFA